MMLDYYLYDNFNPTSLRQKNFALSDGTLVEKPTPAPKARGTILDYELWESGFQYTSSGILSTQAAVGDVVEVMINEERTLALTSSENYTYRTSLLYVITEIDESNKATLQNYFWAVCSGIEIPTRTLEDNTIADIVKIETSSRFSSLHSDGLYYHNPSLDVKRAWNKKNATAELTEVMKTLARVTKLQPLTILKDKIYSLTDGSKEVVKNRVYPTFVSETWNRGAKTTRIDFKANPVLEYETIVERSNYNFLIAYHTKHEDTWGEPSPLTINRKGEMVNVFDYQGDPDDLPEVRTVKTVFYDELPSQALMKSEITADSKVAKIYFDQLELMPLHLNDLLELWFNGKKYAGSIVDRCFTPTNERLIFMEGSK